MLDVPVDVMLYDFEVEQPAAMLNHVAPPYPRECQMAGTSGQVVAPFVVDTTGMAIPASFRAVESTHPLFPDAVRRTLPRMRFTPASIRDRAVRQLVQQAFVFNLRGMGGAAPNGAPTGLGPP